MQDKILDFLIRELVGPNPLDPFIQENGEEILINEPPRIRYTAGILYPNEFPLATGDMIEEDLPTTNLLEENPENIKIDTVKKSDAFIYEDIDNDVNDELINRTNAFLPSAIGFSCFLEKNGIDLLIQVHAGRYKQKEVPFKKKNGEAVNLRGYFRESLDQEIVVQASELPTQSERLKKFPIIVNGSNSGLELIIVSRNIKAKENQHIYTFTLVNTLTTEKPISENEKCFFQCSFNVSSKDSTEIFGPYPELELEKEEDQDTESNKLLFKDKKMFAVGHGCSPTWEENNHDTVSQINADIIPTYELKPILPHRPNNIMLSMYDMSDLGKVEKIVDNLNALCNEYEKWINEQSLKLEDQDLQKFKQTGEKHINECKLVLNRMRTGVKLLSTSQLALKAFQLMNRAMLLQQIHYGQKLKKWVFQDNNKTLEDSDTQDLDINNPATWPGSVDGKIKLGSWHPFQIAFILINLNSMLNPEEDERNIVDLIWFPTGGGKTEAYMGLSAFTIFLKRLKDPNNDGTTVLMRYTLRLLTAQQFQRASSMICASEIIRKDNEEILGHTRFTIGLWVGKDLAPNTRANAIKKYVEITQGKTDENPFLIYKCPWCSAQMGPVKTGRGISTPGYEKVNNPSRIIFICHNTNCEFSKPEFCLPLLVVDEDIYESPPTLLIGTVDKFAMLIWNPEQMRRLFGFREGKNVDPPELIIQDELHLISGPLGSMVGLYETLIDKLCTREINGKSIKAKIIASTATISKAREQVNSLYGRGLGKITIFPAQAIKSGDSFFAIEKKEVTGRRYIGIHASGYSHATAHVRVISALLQSVKSIEADDNDRNYYWTILDYFNSLRELGHAATRIEADVKEYLESIMWKRMGLFAPELQHIRRFINRHVELTSRVESSEITKVLSDLEINYPKKNEDPIDICLATNMVSVGVDIPRLSLMSVTGQPKTTSEYIQATSRVGRSSEGPGIVVVVYNPNKPRDRSHYERFYSYHSTLYKHVEPTSVTPFSVPSCERALHALLVGYIRYFGTDQNRTSASPIPTDQLYSEVREFIKNRVLEIDPDELKHCMSILNEKIDSWKRLGPRKYSDMINPFEDTLIYSPEYSPSDESIKEITWLTPTSMRNVDKNCEAFVVRKYIESS